LTPSPCFELRCEPDSNYAIQESFTSCGLEQSAGRSGISFDQRQLTVDEKASPFAFCATRPKPALNASHTMLPKRRWFLLRDRLPKAGAADRNRGDNVEAQN